MLHILSTKTHNQMSQLTMDKDSLINAYIQEVIDGMDLKDCLAVLHDYMTESYANYSYDEVKEEVEEYYPHLLED